MISLAGMNRRRLKVAIMLLIIVLAFLMYISLHAVYTSSHQVLSVGAATMGVNARVNPRNYGESTAYGTSAKIVYNRVGKCGSRSMLVLISKLSVMNGFTFYKSPISNHSQASAKDLLHIAENIKNMPPPSIYSRHIHYIDFAKYGISHPIYINLIRDPIERFSSHYHFLRHGDHIKAKLRSHLLDEKEVIMDINECVLTNNDLCSAKRIFYVIPYFCGQDVGCQKPGKDSLYRAKKRVMENYLVVGYLEDFDGFLSVLEQLLPKYFFGVTNLWIQMAKRVLNNTATIKKRYINETTRKVLRERLKEEYDFYNFVKLRFDIMKKQLLSSDYSK